MTVYQYKIGIRDYLILPLEKNFEIEEVKQFCGVYLNGIRADRTICLRSNNSHSDNAYYAEPWKQDILLKPADAPAARPVVLPDLAWVRRLLQLGADEDE
jgi:hypothetical protein